MKIQIKELKTQVEELEKQKENILSNILTLKDNYEVLDKQRSQAFQKMDAAEKQCKLIKENASKFIEMINSRIKEEKKSIELSFSDLFDEDFWKKN